jgi:type VI secretion system ImpM family protein
MLGSIKRRRQWLWAATGKHPAAADYIQVGSTSPLLAAVGDWLTKGYTALGVGKDQLANVHSWRFWLRGVKKGSLLCGLVRDSSDRIGRPFPLLIIGEGLLKGWEKQWILLPAQLTPLWRAMEHIATQRIDDVAMMEEAIGQLPAPGSWPENDQWRGEPLENGIDGLELNKFRSQLGAEGFGMLALNRIAASDSDRTLAAIHGMLKDCCQDVPLGVFMGGPTRSVYLAAIDHPLGVADFERLWRS